MEDEEEEITALDKPILPNNLSYITNKKDIYVNLFKISLKKNIFLYEYPFKITPEIDKSNKRLKNKIFRKGYKTIKDVYDECFLSGDFIYSMKEIKTQNNFLVFFYMKKFFEYNVEVLPFQKQIVIDLSKFEIDPKINKSIKIILKNILHSNPNLEFYGNLFVNKNEKKIIYGDGIDVCLYRGFTTNFKITEKGLFLNVALKNKFISVGTILDYLNRENYENSKNHKKIRESLVGRSFKYYDTRKNYIIDDITFDKTVKNTEIKYDGQNILFKEYYPVSNLNQPLIIVKRKATINNENTLYFAPELCHLNGLDESYLKKTNFKKNLEMYTNLNPDERVKRTNEFLNLLNSSEKKNVYYGKKNILPSAKDKIEFYGFDIQPVKENFTAYYMEQPKLIAGNNKSIKIEDKIFKVLTPIEMKYWVFLYEKHNYKDADNFWYYLEKISKYIGIKIYEPEWVEMKDRSNNYKDWTKVVNEYMSFYKYQFVLFFLDKNDFLYNDLKKHSLSEEGLVSQVVKADSIRKNIVKVCYKILIQINNKLGGFTYTVDFKKILDKINIMAMGVDSSQIREKGTVIAMTATINSKFSQMFNRTEIIEKKNQTQLKFCVAKFLKDAVKEFKKKRIFIDGIVIYRKYHFKFLFIIIIIYFEY